MLRKNMYSINLLNYSYSFVYKNYVRRYLGHFTVKTNKNSSALYREIQTEYKHRCNNSGISQIKHYCHTYSCKGRIFPESRVALHELSQKLNEKLYDMYFKQKPLVKKGKLKPGASGEWSCSYQLYWPERMTFECTAATKREAAEMAARSALEWLLSSKKITPHGDILNDQQIIKTMRDTLNTPYQLKLEDNLIEEINMLIDKYEQCIKMQFDEAYEKYLNLDIESLLSSRGISYLDDQECDRTSAHCVYGRVVGEPSASSLVRRDLDLQNMIKRFRETASQLPIDQYSDELARVVNENRATIVVGEAGCGKSTRAPIYASLSRGVSAPAIVSQPRRVAAIGLAERVAAELNEEVGNTVGYQVRLNARLPRPPGGNILYCTSGLLLRRLQTDPALCGCTHVFIDEAHERHINTDLTLLLLRRALQVNTELRLIIMSATLDVDVFSRYFEDIPVIKIPGRTFPVIRKYLPDICEEFGLSVPVTSRIVSQDCRPYVNCTELAEVIKSIDKCVDEGAILVFLPGWAEIKTVMDLLNQYYRGTCDRVILPLHSRLSSAEQNKIFHQFPPGSRKIILATNIAETSVTIPDVTCVIDTGLHRENTVRDGVLSLETVWISKASAEQRSGRAGRVNAGTCFKLYSRELEDTFIAHNIPEIQRVPLDKILVDCKVQAPTESSAGFLSHLIETPSLEAINQSIQQLKEIGVDLDVPSKLTGLTVTLSSLTLPPRVAISLLSSVLYQTLTPALNIISSVNIDIFTNSIERREEVRCIKSSFDPESDHVSTHMILDLLSHLSSDQLVDSYCQKYGLSLDKIKTINDLSRLHEKQLIDASVPTDDADKLCSLPAVCVGCLMTGCDTVAVARDKISTKRRLKTSRTFLTGDGRSVHILSDSVNYGLERRLKSTRESAILFYMTHVNSAERSALVVRETSLVGLMTFMLFSSGHIKLSMLMDDKKEMTLIHFTKHNIQILMEAREAELIERLRCIMKANFDNFVACQIWNVQCRDQDGINSFRDQLNSLIAKMVTHKSDHLKT